MHIIGITGTIGAGKGTVVDYLVKTRGFVHLSARTLLEAILTKEGKPHTRDEMYELGHRLRRDHGADYIVSQLYEMALSQHQPVIIESIRTLGEIATLRQKPDFILLGVDAPIRLRYERILERGSSTDHISFETFVEEEKKEMHSNDPGVINLQGCLERADYIITNDGSMDKLEKSIDEFITKIGL